MTYKMEKFRLFSSSAKVEIKIRSPKRKLMLYSRFGLLAAFTRTLLRFAGALGAENPGKLERSGYYAGRICKAFVSSSFQAEGQFAARCLLSVCAVSK